MSEPKLAIKYRKSLDAFDKMLKEEGSILCSSVKLGELYKMACKFDSENIVFTKINPNLPWAMDNIEIKEEG